MTVLPDAEYIAICALRAAFSKQKGRTPYIQPRIPANAFELLQGGPVVALYKVGGKAPNPGYVDNSMFAVQVMDLDRRAAHRVAREVREHLKAACDRQFTDGEEGYLANFREVSGPMATGDELTSNRPDTFRFVATYMVSTKPIRP
ncbi:hypothetical protein [Streptomyces sp. NPDC059708]|uniref:phage tail termination protein n=1 Tax=Streptomyces sp. NPDC059708 TaxID=3346916 RepID=UPI0036C87625